MLKEEQVSNRPLEDFSNLVKTYENNRILVQPVIVQKDNKMEVYMKTYFIGDGKTAISLPSADLLQPKLLQFDSRTSVEVLRWFDSKRPSAKALQALSLHPDDKEKLGSFKETSCLFGIIYESVNLDEFL